MLLALFMLYSRIRAQRFSACGLTALPKCEYAFQESIDAIFPLFLSWSIAVLGRSSNTIALRFVRIGF